MANPADPADQASNQAADLADIVAMDNDAIAAVWHSHWRQSGYDYREDHKERDTRVYAVRGNWAIEKRLMKAGPAGYTDEITKPGEEIFCRCNYQYIYNIQDLPKDMITDKGRKSLEDIKNARN